MQEMQIWSLSWEDPLPKEMVTHSSILAWEIPWREEPGGPKFVGLEKSQTQLSDWAHTVMYVDALLSVHPGQQ